VIDIKPDTCRSEVVPVQEFVVPLIAAGSTILGVALGGALTLSADHLRSIRDERSKLRQVRLETYSRFLRSAQGHMETSHQRLMTMGEIADRKEKKRAPLIWIMSCGA
jgi:hypothetical protein